MTTWPWLAPERDLLRACRRPGPARARGVPRRPTAGRGPRGRGHHGTRGGGRPGRGPAHRRRPAGPGPRTRVQRACRARPCPCVHWHRDTFTLPDGAVHLAATRRFPHQAFRVGARAYGLQFHVEVDAALAESWRPLLPDGVVLDADDVARVEVGRSAGAAAVRRRGHGRSPRGGAVSDASGSRALRPGSGRRRRGRGPGQAEAARRPPRDRLLRLARVGGLAGVGRADHLVEARSASSTPVPSRCCSG